MLIDIFYCFSDTGVVVKVAVSNLGSIASVGVPAYWSSLE